MIHIRFRPARPASPLWNLVKTVVQAAVFWVLFLAVIPWLITVFETRWGIRFFTFPHQLLVAATGFVLASCLGVWSGITMALAGKGTPFPIDTARELVQTGPYRYVRNPMAIAGLVQGTCVGVGLGSIGTIIYVVAGMIVWHVVVRPIEERDLRERFGQEFDEYRARVRCWIPSFRRVAYVRSCGASETEDSKPIVVFDGQCHLCSATVRFIVRRDRAARFYFASRQSNAGRDLLERHGIDANRHDTIVLVQGDRAYARSTAVLQIARRLKWPWPALFILVVVPRFLRNWIYDRVAANRYRWFGKSEQCIVATDEIRDRLLS